MKNVIIVHCPWEYETLCIMNKAHHRVGGDHSPATITTQKIRLKDYWWLVLNKDYPSFIWGIYLGTDES